MSAVGWIVVGIVVWSLVAVVVGVRTGRWLDDVARDRPSHVGAEAPSSRP